MSDELEADVNEQGGAEPAAASGDGTARGEPDGLRLPSLSMENIGPFDRAEIAFATGDEGRPPVTILTGENGTGKSIVLDAIRGMFGINYAKLERPIHRAGASFRIAMEVRHRHLEYVISTTSISSGNNLSLHSAYAFSQLTHERHHPMIAPPRWVVDFWRSNLATDQYAIPALSHPEHRKYLSGALQGQYRNQDVTALLCYFDYLRDSREPREKQSGEAVYELARTIVSRSLLDGGELLHVRRSDLTPIVRQAGQEVPLANLSSGNAYLERRSS